MTVFDTKVLFSKNTNCLNVIAKLGLTKCEETAFANKFGGFTFIVYPTEKAFNLIFEELEIVPEDHIDFPVGENSQIINVQYFNGVRDVWKLNTLC
jgi:hypothetical protein